MNPRPDDPKGAAGSKKCPLHLIPPHALREVAEVMRLGGSKYGEFNWRHNNVCASTYVAAIMRHTSSWWDGELNDPESLRSHLAHVAASAIIVMDAMDQGTLNLDLPQDNRKTEKDTTTCVYRMLEKGEEIREGDEYHNLEAGWVRTYSAGFPVKWQNTHRRPLHTNA